MRYKNGNAIVSLDLRDGTRIIEYPDNEGLTLDIPLNIDIRVSTQCPYGYNKYTKQSTCAFCHESALVDGKECDYDVLQETLVGQNLPRGTEIALGVNEVTDNLIKFVKNLWRHGLVVNITINERYITEFGDTGLLKLKWKANIMQLTKVFNIVSFDNLGLQQLGIRGKITDEEYKSFYQGEHSMYINAVEQYFAPSSRTRNGIARFNEIDLRSYFQFCEQRRASHEINS